MGRALGALVLIAVLAGCGAHAPASMATGFVNQTRQTDAELWAIWSAAQRSVAESIDLNPLQQTASHAAPQVLPGDARALSTLPQQLTVTAEPDVTSLVLYDETGTLRPDPTGMIACPKPCNVRFTTAYSRYQPKVTRYAASWEQTSSFSSLLQYEFENQILFALGYDMRWR